MSYYTGHMYPRPIHWPGDDEAKPAPEPLVRVQALVNTVELPDGADRLADPAEARPWLVANSLLASTAELTADDLELVRASARPCARCWSTTPAARAERPVLRTAAHDRRRRHRARRVRATTARCVLSAAGDSVRARLVELLLIIRDAQRDGTWARLKACGNDECQWAFYDRSRNHGGTWCEMSSCGNKLKNREFRARRRKATSR